jgi:hypothetical protein
MPGSRWFGSRPIRRSRRGVAAALLAVVIVVLAAVAVVGGLVATGVLKLSGGGPSGGTPTYAVTFTETGLPDGTGWSVTLGASHQTATTTSISFQVASGTYAYVIGTVGGYTSNLTRGNVTVGKLPEPVAVGFAPGPYELGMEVVSTSGSRSTYQEFLALSPTAGLGTAMFGIVVRNSGGTDLVVEDPPTACAPYTTALSSNCTGVTGGWYAVLQGANGSVIATYGSGGWAYGSGVTSITLNGGDSLAVVTAVEYAGLGYSLTVFATGASSVSGSVDL